LAAQKEANREKKLKKKEEGETAASVEPMQVDGEEVVAPMPAAEEEEKDELLDLIEKELADDSDEDDAGEIERKRKRDAEEADGEKSSKVVATGEGFKSI
jgi:hypothetical protein